MTRFIKFSLVDAFFTPVVFRLATYDIEVSDQSKDYMKTMLPHPAMQEWFQDASKEDAVIDVAEVGENR